jgi:hypothetical protein
MASFPVIEGVVQVDISGGPKMANRKGLSQLQRSILVLAKEQGGEVLAREVLIKVYNFRPIRNPGTVRQGKLVFKKAEIGYARYNAATVAVFKAFNRLINRGFAWRIHGGIRMKWSRFNVEGNVANYYMSKQAYMRSRIYYKSTKIGFLNG